jgi:hypothetical protein
MQGSLDAKCRNESLTLASVKVERYHDVNLRADQFLNVFFFFIHDDV